MFDKTVLHRLEPKILAHKGICQLFVLAEVGGYLQRQISRPIAHVRRHEIKYPADSPSLFRTRDDGVVLAVISQYGTRLVGKMEMGCVLLGPILVYTVGLRTALTCPSSNSKIICAYSSIIGSCVAMMTVTFSLSTM